MSNVRGEQAGRMTPWTDQRWWWCLAPSDTPFSIFRDGVDYRSLERFVVVGEEILLYREVGPYSTKIVDLTVRL
jgi:hypothetical protein